MKTTTRAARQIALIRRLARSNATIRGAAKRPLLRFRRTSLIRTGAGIRYGLLTLTASLLHMQLLALPTAEELLKKCAQTLDKTHTSFVVRTRTHVRFDNKYSDPRAASMNGERDKFLIKEQRTDGTRIKTITEMWYGPEARFANSESKRQYSSHTCDGCRRYDYVRPYNGVGRVTVFENYSKKDPVLREFRNEELARSDPASQCFGYLLGDVERFDCILRKAGPARMSAKEKTRDRTTHHVIEADTPNGRYEIWLDPSKGYQFSKAVVVRKPGDVHMGRYRVDPGTIKRCAIEITGFIKVQDLWVPVEARSQMDDTLPGGGFNKASYEITVESIVINPDHVALKSFSIEDIRNGARAAIHGQRDSYTWQNGKLLPNLD